MVAALALVLRAQPSRQLRSVAPLARRVSPSAFGDFAPAMKHWLLAFAMVSLVVSCDRNGTISAIFRLRDDSPVPSWLVLPTGTTRDQVSITIITYEATTSPQYKERFVVRDKRTGRILQEVIGSGYWHPDSERQRVPAGTYPNWVIIEVNGTKEVYEQSEANDLLKIVKK